MSANKSKQQQKSQSNTLETSSRGKRLIAEGALIGWLLLCVIVFLALVSYSSEDPGWSFTGARSDVANLPPSKGTNGLKSGKYTLKAAHKCSGRKEVEQELKKLQLNNEKILLTGKGRVANGVLEILNLANIKEVNNEDFISKHYNEPVFCRLNTMDYNERIDGDISSKSEFYKYPELYKSSFMKYAKHKDLVH